MNKKSTMKMLLLAGLLCGAPSTMSAQTETGSTSTKIYDFAGFGDQTLLELFAKIDKEGRKFPTKQELIDAGIYEEIEFVRSHVRKRQILDREDRLVSNTYKERDLFMNIPAGAGSTIGGYPSKDFASDNFSMWNYTNLFGSWNHGLFQAPGSWADAAHKNGTDIMSGMKFFDTTGGRGGHATGWVNFIKTKNDDGTFKYTRPLIHLLQFLGMDGINYNFEADGYSDSEVIKFHQSLYKYANQVNFNNFHIAIYTFYSTLTSYNTKYLFGENNEKTSDLMLNYASSDFSYNMGPSVQQAKRAMGTAKGLYAGVWIVGMDRGWNRLDNGDAKECGICLWGEHAQSRFWSYNTGGNAQERMSNYQTLLERGFSGGKRNPADRPAISNLGNNWEWSGTKAPLSTFAGLASWIPERSAIDGKLPFSTYFNTGAGEVYTYKGKKTAGSWYNMSNQDIVPTYRWLVYDGNTTNVSDKVQPEFTYEDSYTGGSCLKLTGKGTASATDIVLYKTNLTGTSGAIKAQVAIKTGKDTPANSNLALIVRLKNSNQWKEFDVNGTADSKWVEHTVALTGLSSTDVIDRIGLRVKNVDNQYKLLVGKLAIVDDYTVAPEAVKDLTIQVKEENKSSLSVKATWALNSAAEDKVVYNDDANVDHFEVLYKNGENGTVSEIGRTSQWATYIGDIEMGETDKPFIGVRSVSKDLKTYSPVVWKEVPRANYASLPEKKHNPYGEPELDMSADGYKTAQQVRYVETFKTEGGATNIDYTATGPTGGTNYVDATNGNVLTVNQGQTITIKIKGHEGQDDLRFCFGRGWIDLNGDYKFEPGTIAENGEELFTVGKLRTGVKEIVNPGQTISVTIPNDAKRGMTRMRIVFSDAWFQGSLLPTGKFNKGFAIDFAVNITGTNAERPTPKSSRDEGTAEQPEGLSASTSITSFAGEASALVQTSKDLKFSNVEKAWIFGVDGSLVKVLDNPQQYEIKSLPKGIYLVKMLNNNVIRTQKVVIK
ncbi:T9SS type A sorting domain-containing protein [Prevotella nanceiensis]|jgi:mannosyl-glycoprotein endo-beta-N-acetylglucosaminidase|uniref:GEVED domain-containing protein n=1 Tax=Hoylesella nanceiensis TaxID=425941 RepID=UPI001C602826|nr:GEVED domain-containing protein [Hoylesella nanceiensis]MBW4766408.1 T9SS type A sorting domain-containing protein [Hoylesella nanceiensis]